MKSKITVEIDHDNQPIIQVRYEHSEDVRDKLVKRFLESFSGNSAWAKFTFTDYTNGSQTAAIRPIPFSDVEDEAKVMKMYFDNYSIFNTPHSSDSTSSVDFKGLSPNS